MQYYDSDDEISVSSEIIWSFSNFKKQVLDICPNGKSISEQLITVGGEQTWKVDFFPNGKDFLTNKKLSVVLTLVKTNDKNLLVQTEAVCTYRILNIDANKNYAGKIDRQKFKSFVSAYDSGFDSNILDDCSKNCTIIITINQFAAKSESRYSSSNNINNVLTNNNTISGNSNSNSKNVRLIQISSAIPSNNEEDDYSKKTVYPLHKN